MKIVMVILWLGLIGQGIAQWFFDANMINSWSSHPFFYKNDSSDLIINPSFRLTREWDHVSLDYSGDVYRYREVEARNHYFHDVNLSLFNDKISVGLNYNQRFNTSNDYSYLNYHTMGISVRSAEIKSIPGFRFTGAANQVYYHELPEYDNLKINAGFSFRKRLRTKTTLFLYSSIDVKIYTGEALSYVVPEDSSIVFGKITGGGPGPGGGMGGSGGSSRGGGMLMPGFQDNHPIYQETDYSNVVKWNMSLRLAQSLHQRLGLAVTGKLGRVVGGDSRLLSGPGTTTESSDIFDQSMGYHDVSAGIMLTYVAPRMIVNRFGYDLNHLEYINEGIFSNDTTYLSTTLRRDDRHTFWISTSKSFYPDWPIIREINLEGEAVLYMLKSNSYWYDFTGHTISISFTFKM